MYKQTPMAIERDADSYKTKIKYEFIMIDDLALDLGNQRDIINAIISNFEKELIRILKERS